VDWLIRRVVDGYRALARKIHRRRYDALARHMGREAPTGLDGEAARRGFVILQIDGLAHDHLVQAIARGAAPHIKRLIAAGQLRLAAWQCGFPSTTPAIQAAIMFGQNWDIPGFRWYDKAQRRAVVCKRPATVQALQKQVAEGRPGILTGGASYYNMFDGGAEWAVFTLSAMRPPRFFEGVRGLGLMLLFLFSPLRVWRVVRLALWNYLLDVGRRVLAIFRPSVYRPFDLLSPMAHIFTQVLFQEIITFGVQMDIYRGAPAIYVNNVTYDEIAHHVGPTHPAAFKTIKNIDRQIGQIVKTLQRYGRPYDLFILSDHGMSPATPFKDRFGLSLGDYIVQQIGAPLLLDERWSAPGHALVQARYLLEELRGLEERLSPRNANVVRAMREVLSRRMPWVHDPEQEPWDLAHHTDVAVRVSGPLAHVYFNVSEQRLNLSEVALLYPALLTRLIEHAGIGLVVGREGDETVMLGRGGTLTVRGDSYRLHGSHPLAGLHHLHTQAKRIADVAAFPHSGDLMLLGAWKDGGVVTFEDQIGAHGGLGGPQEKPFMLYPAGLDWPVGAIAAPHELYALFSRYLSENPVA
jgi:hypothetical protein